MSAKRKLLVAPLAVNLALAGFLFGRAPAQVADNGCVEKVEKKTVQGKSLEPLVKEGAEIKILFGFYKCNPVQKGDIVAYYYAGNVNPLVKIVKAGPGDKFYLEPVDNKKQIIINNETLLTSEGFPYQLPETDARMLELYEKDYQGTIPADAYLLFGNNAKGSLDSTRFGLASRNDIIGKVEY